MNEQIRSEPRARNLGVDLLRCLAMWMIACLHILNRGGVLAASSAKVYPWLLPLSVLVNCGVNIYALITGYVTVRGRFRPARAAELWLQVFFWNMVLAAIGECIQPHIMDNFWLRYIFPLTQKCFWYFTAYVGVYAFSPLINRGILALNPRQCRALIWTMLLLFSLGTLLGYLNQGDPWSIGAGYSVLWLLVLYVIGACIRQSGFGSRVNSWKLLLILFLLVFGTTAFLRTSGSIPALKEFGKKLGNLLLYYTSPVLTGISVSLLLLFSRLRVQGRGAKLTAFFAPLTFGVYIIHVHHVNWTWIQGLYRPLAGLSGPLALLAVMASGVGLFLACALLDRLRAELFRILRVRPRLDRLEAKLLGRLSADAAENP